MQGYFRPSLDRLNKEQADNVERTYSYDAVGNRTSRTVSQLTNNKTDSTETQTYKYAANSNRLTDINETAVKTGKAGSIIADAKREYGYDARGRLLNVKVNGVGVAEFRYNAFGERVLKYTSSGTTAFVYGPNGQLLGEQSYDGTGKRTRSQYYIWLDDMPLGGVTQSYDSKGVATSSTPFFLHSDHLNTPRLATSLTGATVWQWNSDAFGVGKATGSLTVNLRFPGQYFDAETGLHYNYFRDYDPETGRYVESDPIGLAGGLNTFGYVEGNPLKLIDPKGLSALTIPAAKAGATAGSFVCPGAGTIIGGVIGAGLGAAASAYLGDKLFNESSDQPDNPPSIPDDPTQPPGEGWEWRGKGEPGSRKGAWHNPNTGESLHDDRTHPAGKDPHVTYTDPSGKRWDNYGTGWGPQ